MSCPPQQAAGFEKPLIDYLIDFDAKDSSRSLKSGTEPVSSPHQLENWSILSPCLKQPNLISRPVAATHSDIVSYDDTLLALDLSIPVPTTNHSSLRRYDRSKTPSPLEYYESASLNLEPSLVISRADHISQLFHVSLDIPSTTPYDSDKNDSPNTDLLKGYKQDKSNPRFCNENNLLLSFDSPAPSRLQPSLPPFDLLGSSANCSSLVIERSGLSASFATQMIPPYNAYLSSESPRLCVPDLVRHPTVPDLLQSEIIESWIFTEPNQEKRISIERLLQTLTDLINHESHSSSSRIGGRYRVDVFGSVSWGGETGANGDLDLVIIDNELPQGYHPSVWRVQNGSTRASLGRAGHRSPVNPNVPEVYNMHWLASLLRSKGNMIDVRAITGATTPIVKFRSKLSNLECDLTTNDLGGWYNSSLILQYCKHSPYVLRPLIHTLKKWAAAHYLNDPAGAKGPPSMSSYCLTLMAIAYLQYRGTLPNFQATVTGKLGTIDPSDSDTVWLSWGRTQGQLAHVWFSRAVPDDWRQSDDGLTAGDAVRGFFAYFSRSSMSLHKFDYATQLVSILNGGIIYRPKSSARTTFDLNASTESFGSQSIGSANMLLGEHDTIQIDDNDLMGNIRGNIKSKTWNEKLLIVQDPFIWEKNCAAGMSKVGLDRFMKTVDDTHRLLDTQGAHASLGSILTTTIASPFTLPKQWR